MFSVVRENILRRMLNIGLVGGVTFTFFAYCLLTGDDDVLRSRGSRANRVARADYDHDTDHHHDGCLSIPSAVVTHDGQEAIIWISSSGQTTPKPLPALITEAVAVPDPQYSSDILLTIALLSTESRDLIPFNSRAPPQA